MPTPMPQQSPINLTDPVHADFGRDKLQIHWKKSASGLVKKDEHGVTVTFAADERQYVVLDQKRFHLVQFHFHHPSEHWVDGRQQTMELHVVHQNADDGSRAVVGVFIEATDKGAVVPALVPQLKAILGGSGDDTDPTVAHNPLEFLPENTDEYYRYEGSLTTPEFDENVSWAVLRQPKLLPKAELVDLIKLFKHPARLPQGLNRRFLLANFRTK
ncbi:MAG: carbonic anhydrase family protein [Gemmataceae bacterium]